MAGRNLFADAPAAPAKTGKNLFADKPPTPVEEDYGPFGLGDNFARAGQTLDDSMRIIADTGSRGYIDKWLGPEAEAATAAARERQGWGGTAVDISSTLATMPYQVRGALGGSLFGAGEGALRSYGNQEDWTPDWGKIAQDTGIGAALGATGAALPKVWNAGKDVLGKFGSIPKWKTGIFDYAFLGAPVVTGASTASKVAAAVTPKLPTGPVTRDVLAKAMMTMGGRQAE